MEGQEVQDGLGKLTEALSKASLEFKTLTKNKEVAVRGETKGGRAYEYKFRYADLEQLISSTREALAKHGLVIAQRILTNAIETCLYHVSGETLTARMDITLNGTPQENGAKITYYRRYQYAALLNLCAEDDDDGGAGGDTTITDKKTSEVKADPARPLVSCETIVSKLNKASTIEALDEIAKEYRDDYERLSPDEQVRVRRAKDTLKSKMKGDV